MENSAIDPGNLAGWLALVEAHLQRYPVMTAWDVYKLLFQGVRGPEHLMPSAEQFTARLEAELAELQLDSDAVLLEAIRPDGALHRIHLRPWLAAGRPLAELVEACLAAARRPWEPSSELERVWQAVSAQVAAGRFPSLNPADVQTVDRFVHEHGFPPVHHSLVYRMQVQPAYRLVAGQR